MTKQDHIKMACVRIVNEKRAQGIGMPLLAQAFPGVGPAVYGASRTKDDRLAGVMRGIGDLAMRDKNAEAYAQGFEQVCTRRGINPLDLIKAAQQLPAAAPNIGVDTPYVKANPGKPVWDKSAVAAPPKMTAQTPIVASPVTPAPAEYAANKYTMVH